ncbi:MAG: 30S ribosome-binding factor RbfA [Pseudomonadota bacterium]
MAREFSRNQRLGNQVLRTLSELLRNDVKDPRVASVSLTTVDLSRDLGVARVYFSLLDPAADPEPVADGLARASGFLRGRLGQALKVRHVPELRFVHDDSAEHAMHISELLEKTGDVGPASDSDSDKTS